MMSDATMARPVEEGESALAEAALRFVRLWVPARSAAFFMVQGKGLVLVTSHGLDQAGLDDVARLWSKPPFDLTQAAPYRWQSGEREVLVLWCASSDGIKDSRLVYLELMEDLPLRSPRRLRGLIDVLSGPIDPFDARDQAPSNADAANLAFLLERNEWNVARVARLLGVTRMTVYNRMRKHGLPRQRVPKTKKLRAGKPEDASPHQQEPPSA